MSNHEVETQNETVLTKPRPFFWKNIGILFSGFSAVVLIIVMGVALYGILVLNGKLAQSVEMLSQQLKQIDQTSGNTQQSLTNLQQLTDEMQTVLKNQNQTLVDLQKSQRPNKANFLAADAYSLVKLASYHLQYEKNTALAIKLLQEADQQIAKINDAAAYPVRAALAKDLAALQRVTELDVTGIYLRLSALSEQLNNLPIINASRWLPVQSAPEKNEKISLWWRRVVNALDEVLRRIVIVRHANVLPFITPEQQLFLYQNLQAEIEQAKWGLLHRQPAIYRGGLQQVEKWVRQYGVPDATPTQQSLLDLQQLIKIEINPALPTVMKSLEALQVYTSKGE